MESAERAVPRNIGDGKRDRRADHCNNLGLAIVVNRHNGEGEGNVIAKVLREERTNGTVDNAGSENCLFAGLAFSLEVTAGDLTCGIHSLLKVYGERKEVDALAGLFGCGCGAKNGSLTVSYKARAVCKACKLAGLNNKRTACECVVEYFVLVKYLSGTFDLVHNFVPPKKFIFIRSRFST